MRNKILSFVLPLLLGSGQAFGQSARVASDATVGIKTREEIVSYFRKVGFSGAVALHSPKTQFAQALGMEGAREIRPQDHFLIGSITKQFTAAAILKLVDQGRLKLTDSASKYVPSFPHAKITIHHLLSQTSGLSDITDEKSFGTYKDTRFVELEPLIADISRLPTKFEPGAHFEYSNSNYMLLSKVVEAASGESWWSFVHRELIVAAGMRQTRFSTERGPDVVTGHTLGRDNALVPIKDEEYFERGWANGAGGLESTVDDLVHWNEALYGGRLLSRASLEKMMTRQAEVAEDEFYGYGLFIKHDRKYGMDVYSHSGGIPGFITHNLYDPREKLSAVALSNYMSAEEPARFARALASQELHGRAEVPRLIDDARVTPASRARHVGVYMNEEDQKTIRFIFEKGQLYEQSGTDQPQRLIARGPRSYYNRSNGDAIRFQGGRAIVGGSVYASVRER